jgi:hypothetical protein
MRCQRRNCLSANEIMRAKTAPRGASDCVVANLPVNVAVSSRLSTFRNCRRGSDLSPMSVIWMSGSAAFETPEAARLRDQTARGFPVERIG